MKCLQKLKLVTFDATNTILKFKVPPWQLYGRVARRLGYRGRDEDLAKHFVHTYKAMWATHNNFGKASGIGWEEWWMRVVRATLLGAAGDAPTRSVREEEAATAAAALLVEEYRTAAAWRAADGCDQLLQLLRDNNLTLGVISNFDPRLHDILHNLNLKQYFDFIVTSYESGYTKPDTRIFESAIQKCGIGEVTPDVCLHIGDDVVKDYEGATAAGWHALLLCEDCNPCRVNKPQHILRSLHEFMATIQSNNLVV